uniref:Tetraspanin n=1 Tax=Gongylonema pulchrum TaxID=637853 RepID=A0A183CZN5_9BILA
LALIFLSLWMQLDPRRNYVLDLVDFSEDDPLLRGATYLALITGAVTLIVGFIGCCGAIKKSLCMIVTFVICLLIIFFADVTIACFALFYRNKFIGSKLSAYLTMLTHDRYHRVYWVTPLIDTIQYYVTFFLFSLTAHRWLSRYDNALSADTTDRRQDCLSIPVLRAHCCLLN